MRRPLFLSGFMAAGKTTVGRRVAELARVPFVDLDARVEAEAGLSVAEIFREQGEGRFRELERALLSREMGDSSPRVLALGGGALLARTARLQALEVATLVCLEVSAEQAHARNGDGARPLLTDLERAAELLEARRAGYAEAHACIATEGRDPVSLAQEVLALWQRDPIAVAAGLRSYSVELASDGHLGTLALGDASGVLLVSDDHVAPLYAARVEALRTDVATVKLTPGEAHKQVGAVESIWRAAHGCGLDRRGVVVGLGGGVVTDMAGFAAATWLRGVPWAALPTSLLAMVDASVGGKTGVDFADVKNGVGAFWQPRQVICDVSFLRTEPTRGFVSALAEVVKTALIGDVSLLQRLEASPAVAQTDLPQLDELVRRCLRVKAQVVSRDEREGGLRATLNLGHTFGHALEAVTDYRRFTHGEAVSLGLVAALRLGVLLGETPPDLADRVVSLLSALGLPTDLSAVPLAAATSLLGRDKKRTGKHLRFVLCRAPQDVSLVDIALSDLERLATKLG